MEELGGEPRIFEEDNQRMEAEVEGKIPVGLTYAFNTKVDEIDNTLVQEDETSLFKPEYSAFVGLTLTQPLLKNSEPT